MILPLSIALLAAGTCATVYLVLRFASESERRAREERAALLDRIQAPQAVMASLMPAQFEEHEPTQEEIDRAFAERAESVIGWDQDLVPHPGEESE